MQDLHGRTAVVTGGASGIGLATARRLAAEGMNLVLADIEEPPLAEAVSELEAGGAAVIGVRADVSDKPAVESLRDRAVERFGSVELLFNNAGVGAGGALLDPSADYEARWDWVLGINLGGVLNGIRVFVPDMAASGNPGHVVNTASVAGLIPAALGAYTVSKYGVVALSELLASELAATEVGVSVLCPEFVSTRIADSDRHLPEHLVRTEAPSAEQEFVRAAVNDLVAGGIDPAEVADKVLDAVRTQRFLILTHASSVGHVAARAEQLLAGVAPAPWDATP